MTTTVDPVQTFKIIVVGDSGVGKTSLMNRLVHGVFNNSYAATIGVDFKVAMIKIGEYKCRVQIWDTAGQERFRSMTSSYYRGADGIIIVYDVTNQESFGSIQSRFPEMDFFCDESIPRILVGNKDDDDHQAQKVVLTRYGQDLAEQNNLLFFETSVKDDRNITEVFNRITKLALQRRLGQGERIQNNVAIDQTTSMSNHPNKTCCFA